MTENTKAQIGKVLAFCWGTSRGRDTYGYNICTLKVDGARAAQCSGGGYDLMGTCLGEWIAKAMPAELLDLARFRADRRWNGEAYTDRLAKGLYGLTYHSHTVTAHLDGASGFESMERILEALGLRLEYKPTSRKNGVYLVVKA